MSKNIVEVDIDLKEFIPEFIEGKKKDFHSIDSLIRRKDFDAIYRIGHGLKGTGSAYGFHKITKFGIQLEKYAKERNEESIALLCKEAIDHLDNIEIRYIEIE